MRSFYLAMILLLCFTNSKAQDNYSIAYQGNGSKWNDLRLVIDSNISFSYTYDKHIDPYKDSMFFEKQVHALFFAGYNNTFFFWPLNKKKENYILIDTTHYNDWIIGPETKQILGYNCIGAYSIAAIGDTAFVFFTKDLKYPFGPQNFVGLPGVVLEAWKHNSILIG